MPGFLYRRIMKQTDVKKLYQLSLQGHTDALDTLEKAAKTGAKQSETCLTLAQLFLELKDPAKAQHYLARIQTGRLGKQPLVLSLMLQLAALKDDFASWEQAWALIEKRQLSLEWQLDAIRKSLAKAVLTQYQNVMAPIFDKFEALAPNHPDFLLSKCDWLIKLGDMQVARDVFARLPAFDTLSLRNRIKALMVGSDLGWKQTGHHLEAIYSDVMGLDKPEEKVLRLLIRLLNKETRLPEKLQAEQVLVDCYPDNFFTTIESRLDTWQRLSEWENVEQNLPLYLAAVKEHKCRPTSLFRHLSLPGLTDKEQYDLAQAFIQRFDFPDVTKTPVRPAWQKKRRLKVGFLSSDFMRHPVAQLLMEVMERYDTSRFEFVAYDNTKPHQNHWRERILSTFEHVTPVRSMTNGELISTIRRDQLDILMEMQGSTTDSRCWLLRYRLAPVQIGWLGFLGTLGGPVNDYILADQHTVPEAAKPYFSEKVIWMPDFHFPADTQRQLPAPPPRLIHGLPEDAIVYCSFSAQYKINPDTFAIWMNILKHVKNAVLWLVDQNDATTQNLIHRAKEHGVDPARLIFAKKVAHNDHLARLQLADIALDTWPHNSGATAIDTLWAGVPLVTFSGNTMMSRVAAGMVNTLGMPELCRTDPHDYETYAIELGQNPASLAKVKQALKEKRRTSPLYQPERFTRHFERALEMAYARFEQGLRPDDINVPSIEQLPVDASESPTTQHTSAPVPVLLEKGDFALNKELYADAQASFEHALAQDPRHPHAHYGLGMALGLQGDYTKALSLMEKATAIAPDKTLYSKHLEIMRQKASQNWQKQLDAWLNEGLKHQQSGRFSQAQQCYDAILDQSPQNPAALHFSGLLAVQQNDPSGLEKMKTSIELQPQNRDFLKNYRAAVNKLKNAHLIN